MCCFVSQVLITIYWLGRKAHADPFYNGPYLKLKAFEGLLGTTLYKVRHYTDIIRYLPLTFTLRTYVVCLNTTDSFRVADHVNLFLYPFWYLRYLARNAVHWAHSY